MKYSLYSKEGWLKADVSEDIVNDFIVDKRGFYRNALFEDGTSKSLYEITESFTYGNDDIKLFILAGDTLRPVD